MYSTVTVQSQRCCPRFPAASADWRLRQRLSLQTFPLFSFSRFSRHWHQHHRDGAEKPAVSSHPPKTEFPVLCALCSCNLQRTLPPVSGHHQAMLQSSVHKLHLPPLPSFDKGSGAKSLLKISSRQGYRPYSPVLPHHGSALLPVPTAGQKTAVYLERLSWPLSAPTARRNTSCPIPLCPSCQTGPISRATGSRSVPTEPAGKAHHSALRQCRNTKLKSKPQKQIFS